MGGQAVYIGKVALLKGKAAIIRPTHNKGYILAQFTDPTLDRKWTELWAPFATTDFQMTPDPLNPPAQGELL